MCTFSDFVFFYKGVVVSEHKSFTTGCSTLNTKYLTVEFFSQRIPEGDSV